MAYPPSTSGFQATGVSGTSTAATAPGRYELGVRLGTGGMASVHRAVDRVLGREVAVKRFDRCPPDAGAARVRDAEGRMHASLRHPGLVTLLDAGIDGQGVPFLVLDLVDGADLRSRIRREPFDLPAAAYLGLDVAEALDYLHSRGVVHRDIKPANVLLGPGSGIRPFRARLADFGIAVPVAESIEADPQTTTGTAAYLSPEQASGRPVGPASDVYSLGLVVLEAITGHVEFPGDALTSAFGRLERDPELPDGLPAAWRHLLAGMTARSPQQRPTAGEVMLAFRQLVIDADAPERDELEAPGALGRLAALARRIGGARAASVTVLDQRRAWVQVAADAAERDPLAAAVAEADAAGLALHGPVGGEMPDLSLPITGSDGTLLGVCRVFGAAPAALAEALPALAAVTEIAAHDEELRRVARRLMRR
ncbi:serine/threonine-protein kinase [Amnibacterium sp. CER49]|uniref:serine/threonine-protein kinase n=1 Tax=Amnibacterium sp. CER49 TaxID=3039161 RepID=UPI00244C35FE|nr:serine/threonine-protein kinase [Amnibacterium sp. CER49]MDH2443825.1 serine/threonine-protein kinase [Amnibacterium sp. CER49]